MPAGFRLPTFNLVCAIGRGSGLSTSPQPPFTDLRLPAQSCGLTYGRRVNPGSGDPQLASNGGGLFMSLLLPALTDVRSIQSVDGTCDLVECPAGSGRWYSAQGVDDIGKGFANEHRTALLVAVPNSWPVPYP